MINGLELRIVALLADSLVARTHLTVRGGPAPGPLADVGKGRLVVSVSDFSPDAAFLPERVRDSKSPPDSRRVLGLNGSVRLVFQVQPAAATPAAEDAARSLLLEDMSLAAHALANPVIGSGAAFATGADEGFRVSSFLLEKGTGTAGLPGIPNSAELLYRCRIEIWPLTPPDATGVIGDVSRTLALLPIEQEGAEHDVRAGQSVSLKVSALPKLRPAAAGQPAQPLRVAIKVLSTAPPAARGAVTNGVDGAEPGVRVLAVTDGDVSITFQAPALASGQRTEYVAVHYATPDNRAGVFLGSIAVRIRGGA